MKNDKALSHQDRSSAQHGAAGDQEKRLEDLLKEGIHLVLARYGKKPIA